MNAPVRRSELGYTPPHRRSQSSGDGNRWVNWTLLLLLFCCAMNFGNAFLSVQAQRGMAVEAAAARRQVGETIRECRKLLEEARSQ